MVSAEKYSINVTIVGAGNVAWHLGHTCYRSGMNIIRVINRSEPAGKDLAGALRSGYSADFQTDLSDSDFILVAVKDSVLGDVLHRIGPAQAIILHTSGSLGIDIFPSENKNVGVLYPFQTLTRNFPADFSNLPLCIEAFDKNTLSTIRNFAGKLGSNIWELSSEQRRYLHLSGIIVNNFTNHLAGQTFKFMEKHHLDRKLIMPLIKETIRKLDFISPEEAQTGPARRKDLNIVQKHLELLSDEPELKKLYSFLTDSIIAYYS